jgi:flagellar assembly factor FliW
VNAGDRGAEILFSEGVIGVSRARRFELLERSGSPIRVLRCLDIEGFALPVVDPRLADPDYRPAISARVSEALGLSGEGLLLLLAVTTLEPAGPVANLRAPLVINVEKRIGAQVILDDRRQPLRAKVATKP